MIVSANQNLAALHLLEMALHAEVRVPDGEQLGVHCAVSTVTSRATFVHGFVLKHVRTTLSRVALETGFILCAQSGAASDVCESFVR